MAMPFKKYKCSFSQITGSADRKYIQEEIMNNTELKEYRTKLYTDLYSGIIPDRVPINDGFGIEYFIKYSGEDLMLAQYSLTTEKIIGWMEKVRDDFAVGDTFNTGSPRNAIGSFFQKSTQNVMSKSGFIQHPETSALSDAEFDEYIKAPYDYTQSVIRPRASQSYVEDPVMRTINFMRYYFAAQDFNKTNGAANAYIAEKYGLFTTPAGSTGRNPVVFDNLADSARGFSQIVLDIKRCPQKVLDAMEALMPYAIYSSNKSKAHILGANNIMTHMGPFLRQKEFDKFYLPNFIKICHISAQRGQASSIFCEQDWTRFIDELSELPMGTRLYMEYGDPQKFKDKLGKKFVLGGFYPVTLLKNGTKEQCVDKAKELMDILAPGGNYFFRFDKVVLDTADIIPENYTAVMEYVLEHGKYTNAGEKVSDVDPETTIHRGYDKDYPEFKTKYIQSFEEFSADYPVADEKATELVKAAYDKYTAMALATIG